LGYRESIAGPTGCGDPSGIPEGTAMADGHLVFNSTAALARLGGDIQLFKDLIGFLLEDSPTLLAKLREAVAQGNAAQVARAAHSLKGLVANFDAHTAAAVAQKLESQALLGELAGAAAEVDQLASHLVELEGQLRDYLAQN